MPENPQKRSVSPPAEKTEERRDERSPEQWKASRSGGKGSVGWYSIGILEILNLRGRICPGVERSGQGTRRTSVRDGDIYSCISGATFITKKKWGWIDSIATEAGDEGSILSTGANIEGDYRN